MSNRIFVAGHNGMVGSALVRQLSTDPNNEIVIQRSAKQLGWQPTTTLDEMIAEMVASDLAAAKQNRLLRDSVYEVNHARE